MFGMMEAMLSFLRRQVGLRTDAADAAGSLHAKVGDVKSYLINTIYSYLVNTINATINAQLNFKNKQPRFAGVVCKAGTTTVLSVSGAGYLTGIAAYVEQNGIARLIITIDGTVQYDGVNNLNFARGLTTYQYGHNSLSMLHRFNSSLLVRAEFDNVGGVVHVSYLLD